MDQEATKGEPMAVIMGFDQSPSNPRKSWWTTFLGLETPVHYGLEQWARRYDMAVVYASIRHEGPWRYSPYYEVIAEDVSDLAEGVILDRCLTALEREIHADPARWLWSHKRWKHRRPEGGAPAPANPGICEPMMEPKAPLQSACARNRSMPFLANCTWLARTRSCVAP